MADGQGVDGGDRQAVSHIVAASSIVRGYVVSILRSCPSCVISAEAGNSGFGVERLGPCISRDQVEIARPMFDFDVQRVVVGKAVKNGVDQGSHVLVGHACSCGTEGPFADAMQPLIAMHCEGALGLERENRLVPWLPM